MPLLAVGINHKTAPVNIRERVAFAPERMQQALHDLVTQENTREAAILSTCNRTEIYCDLENSGNHRIVEWLGRYHDLPVAEFQPYLYQHPDQLAVRHMLRVASGLDSMVLGEPQILGQVKSAYQTANSAGTLGALLKRLFQHTFAVAKQVRTDTNIGASAVSVAFAAVNLSKQIFAKLHRQTALLIGAGETVELVARHLHQNQIGRMIVANRTFQRAHDLASPFGAYAIGLDEIPSHLAEADIIISSTASPGFVLTSDQIKGCLKQRKHRPVFIVDIAVPRDVDPQVGEFEDVYLYTVDDLQDIIEENLRSRQEAAKQAEEIVDTQVDHFMAWLRVQDSVGTIRALRHQAENIRDEVCLRAQKQLDQGKEPVEVMRFLANTLTNKMLHAPSTGLREAGAHGRDDIIEMIIDIYKLHNSDQR